MLTSGHNHPPYPIFMNLKVFFMPLGGFFNFLIFVSHKIYAMISIGEEVISYVVSNPGFQWGHLEDTDAEKEHSPRLDPNADNNL